MAQMVRRTVVYQFQTKGTKLRSSCCPVAVSEAPVHVATFYNDKATVGIGVRVAIACEILMVVVAVNGVCLNAVVAAVIIVCFTRSGSAVGKRQGGEITFQQAIYPHEILYGGKQNVVVVGAMALRADLGVAHIVGDGVVLLVTVALGKQCHCKAANHNSGQKSKDDFFHYLKFKLLSKVF